MGEVRRYWATDALIEMEPEIAQAEEWAMTNWREAFENVVRRFGRPA